jgi:hypothetical protein
MLDLQELLVLYQECRRDADSAQVLEAYLDRNFSDEAGWREKAQTQGTGDQSISVDESKMTKLLALEILGLEELLGRKQVIKAHRSLMQKLHPDRGGSDYLAKRINAAKTFLLELL